MSETEISTKEKIIQATFSLLQGNLISDISLSRIAKEVNISKTAIYRHFESKKALERAIKEKIFSDMLGVMVEVDSFYQKGEYEKSISFFLRFLNGHPEYLNYGLFSTPDVGEDRKLNAFRDAGIKITQRFFDENYKIRDFPFYVESLFVLSTMIDFTLSRFGFSGKAPVFVKDYEEFERQVIKIIDSGLGIELPSFEKERLASLDKICRSSLEGLPPLDRKLEALSNVIFKVGFPNVTVEALANELGMAKSSLYTWFSDKKEMISSLLVPELNLMLSSILNSVSKVTSFQEKLYVLMRTEFLYFTVRSKMIAAGKWIQLGGNYRKSVFEDLIRPELNAQFMSDFGNELTKIIKERFSIFDYEVVIGWIFCFPVFLVVNAIHHGFSKEDTDFAIESLFNMVLSGLTLKR